MENRKADHSPDEFEVVQMFWVDAGVWVDLQGIIVMCWVFEQTVEGIEHFVRKQEEEFAKHMSVKRNHWFLKTLTEKDRHNQDHLLRRIWS